jgi:hypothetical protein
MKRTLKIATAALVVLLAAGAVLFLRYGTESAAVQRWIAGQLEAVAGHYLNPRLSLGALHYQYPSTAVVDDVRLVADDPARPGATVDVFVAKQVTLEMAEVPRSGQPLRIQKLILDHPEFRAVTVSETDSRLVGYSNLLKGATTQPEVKLSDVFEIRLIQLVGGLLLYDPRTPGAKPMEVDQIDSVLNVAPAEGGEIGWYRMELNLGRQPVFSTHVAGRVNIDTLAVELEPLRVELKLGRDQDHYLPPQLQSILKDHEVSGELAVEASGLVQASDWRASSLKAQVTLTDGNVAAGEHHLPVDRLEALWTMADRQGTLARLDAELLGGRLEATGEVALNDPLEARAHLTLSDIRLEQCLRAGAGGEGTYRGALSGRIDWDGPLADARKQSRGSGTVRVVDGDLVHFPVLSELLSVLTKTMKAVHLRSDRSSDTADVAFTFEGDRVNFSKVSVVTQLAALRGHGDLYLDARLDMLFNVEPGAKVRSALGAIGDLLGTVADQVSAYTVTGTLAKPKVGIKVAPKL